MGQARANLSVAVFDGKIYAFGGTSKEGRHDLYGPSQGSYSGGPSTTTEVYDPSTNAWTRKSYMKTPMTGFSTVVCDNKIFCIDDDPVMEVYDPANDNWSVTSPKLVARQSTRLVFED
jgi:N-acetylneuraminic acid mutarotase